MIRLCRSGAVSVDRQIIQPSPQSASPLLLLLYLTNGRTDRHPEEENERSSCPLIRRARRAPSTVTCRVESCDPLNRPAHKHNIESVIAATTTTRSKRETERSKALCTTSVAARIISIHHCSTATILTTVLYCTCRFNASRTKQSFHLTFSFTVE